MATMIYRVCNGTNRTNVTITDDWVGNEMTRYYTIGSCQITERTRVLRFTASQAVDTPYRVWYTYEMQQYDNGVLLTPNPILTGFFDMPIGNTVYTVEVKVFEESDCTEDTGGLIVFDVQE